MTEQSLDRLKEARSCIKKDVELSSISVSIKRIYACKTCTVRDTCPIAKFYNCATVKCPKGKW